MWLALAVMNTRLCCGLSENLSLNNPSTFLIPTSTFASRSSTLTIKHNIFPLKKKVFNSFFASTEWIKRLAFAYSLLLSQSAIFPFDLLFIWLSLCITRLFILHFNIWWDHLWSWVCCSGVTLVSKCFFSSVCSFSSIIVGMETLSTLLIIPFK